MLILYFFLTYNATREFQVKGNIDMMTLLARFEVEIEGTIKEFLSDVASNEWKSPSEIWQYQNSEDHLYNQCYGISRKYHSLGLEEASIRSFLSSKGIQN